MLKTSSKPIKQTKSKSNVRLSSSTRRFSSQRRTVDTSFGLQDIQPTQQSYQNSSDSKPQVKKDIRSGDDFFSWGDSATKSSPPVESRGSGRPDNFRSDQNRNDKPRRDNKDSKTNDSSSFPFGHSTPRKVPKSHGKMANPFDSGDEQIFNQAPVSKSKPKSNSTNYDTPSFNNNSQRSSQPQRSTAQPSFSQASPSPPSKPSYSSPSPQIQQTQPKTIPSFDAMFDNDDDTIFAPPPKRNNKKLNTATMTSSFTTSITPIGGSSTKPTQNQSPKQPPAAQLSPINSAVASSSPYNVTFGDNNDLSEDVDAFFAKAAPKPSSTYNSSTNRSFDKNNERFGGENRRFGQNQQHQEKAYGNHQRGDRFGNIRERIVGGDQGPRVANFHIENEEELVEFRSKQQVLFESNPNHAAPSQFKNLRDGKAPNKYITPNLPVPIVGEALYGTHAVYSALVNQKRKINQMYILASVYEEVKRAARPKDFRDKDAFKEFTGKLVKGKDNENGAELDQLIDPSFLIDSSSPKIKSIMTHFNDGDDDMDKFVNHDGNTGGKYVNPHHLESNREHLMTIYELAASIPGLQIFSLRRDKLDMLSGSRPHNGVVLDVEPLRPTKKSKLENEDFFIVDTHVSDMTSASMNLKEGTKEHTVALRSETKLLEQVAKVAQNGENVTDIVKKPAVYLAVESVFDPNNLGAILRSSTFFGVDSLILPHNSCPLSAVVAKVSSGALDSMPIVRCNNLSEFISDSINASHYSNDPQKQNKQSYIDFSKKNNTPGKLTRNFDNLCVIGLGLTDDINNVSGSTIFDFLKSNLIPQLEAQEQEKSSQIDPFSILLIAGNEGFGLSEHIVKKCHLMLQIPSEGRYPTSFNGISIRPVVDSLNVSNAVAIAVNDVMASRRRVM